MFCSSFSFSALVTAMLPRVVVVGRGEVVPRWHSPLGSLLTWGPGLLGSCSGLPGRCDFPCSPANPFWSAAASGSLLSLRFSPCSFLLASQLLSAFKEVANQKKAKHLAQVARSLPVLPLPLTLQGWKTLPLSLDVEVLPCSLVSHTPIKHFPCF